MTEKDIEKLIHMNQRLTYLLGFAAAFMMDYKDSPFIDPQKEKYNWFFKSVENIIYFDKLLEPMP